MQSRDEPKALQEESLPSFEWFSQDMGIVVDLEDKEALWAILDERPQSPSSSNTAAK